MAEIKLEQLTKVYPDGTKAVKELDLEIADGELVVLVGPSGCGKTSALRMVAGLEDITDGRVWIGGRVVNKVPPKDRHRDDLPELRALPAHDGRAEYGLRASDAEASEATDPDAGERRRRRPRAHAGAQQTAAHALGRPAPARRDGPSDRSRATGVPDGRAALEPRRKAP